MLRLKCSVCVCIIFLVGAQAKVITAAPLLSSVQWHETPRNEIQIRLGLSEAVTHVAPENFNITPELMIGKVEKISADESSREFLLHIVSPLADHGSYLIRHRDINGEVSLNAADLAWSSPVLSAARRAQVPQPWLPQRADWIALYYAAWGFMEEKITQGNTDKGFVPLYIDEGFNHNIYQWDSAFMAAYAIYSPSFPAMQALDNFYVRQKADGYIARTYDENTGLATGPDELNPPLFAWMELRYVNLTGDQSRLKRVVPVLDKYYRWIKKNASSKGLQGAVYINNFGSGMDNSPREEFIHQGAWIDLTAQQGLAAQALVELTKRIDDQKNQQYYEAEYERIKTLINDNMWSEKDGIYLDKDEKNAFHRRFTIASFWPLTAQLADAQRAKITITQYLKNPQHFFTPHLFPTLSRADVDYDPFGHYWRGAVWAPTNFAVIKGLAYYDPVFAFEASVNHIDNMAKVYTSFDPATYPKPMPTMYESNVKRNGKGVQQIWEAYSSEKEAPATRWDAELLVRQKFCGWSGVGPVALLIEQVLGLDINGDKNQVTWVPRLNEAQGLDNFSLRGAVVNMHLEPQEKRWLLTTNTNNAFTLNIQLPGKPMQTLIIKAGKAAQYL